MPVKKGTADGAALPAYTDTEQRFIKAVFDNMTTKPDANWDRVAQDLGLKDAKCAKERFRQMSNRHKWGDQGSAASPTKPKASPKEGRVTKPRATRPTAVKRGVDKPSRVKMETADEGEDEAEQNASEYEV